MLFDTAKKTDNICYVIHSDILRHYAMLLPRRHAALPRHCYAAIDTAIILPHAALTRYFFRLRQRAAIDVSR